ncbi:MAG TPA: response regulator transcription factor, partial [Saprospiraceae bacterium]|nr:response regulator transcription factor [Saprospiraceae bacterium]
CLIVEDEPLAVEVIQDYIFQVPFLNVTAICNDAIHAMEVLQKEKIDLIFLDIHLPKIKGLDFLKTLKIPPKVIITSAYHEYALKSYEHNVIDYLLKPIEFSRFLSAVNKIKSIETQETIIGNKPLENEYQFFVVGKKKVKLYLNEILYIEGQKEYVHIYTASKNIITKLQMTEIVEMLPKADFIRIHRSFIVAKSKVDAFSATEIEINNKLIPIGRSYKELVVRTLGT